MEKAHENGKELSNSAHAKGMNENCYECQGIAVGIIRPVGFYCCHRDIMRLK
jgi:hypothetical protein